MCLERVLACQDCPETQEEEIYLCEAYKRELQKRRGEYTYENCPMYNRVLVKLDKFDMDYHNCPQLYGKRVLLKLSVEEKTTTSDKDGE